MSMEEATCIRCGRQLPWLSGMPPRCDLVLTPREREIVALLPRGKHNKEIAKTFVISVKTVENHLHNIYQKLQVSGRTEAAIYALQHGIGDKPARKDR